MGRIITIEMYEELAEKRGYRVLDGEYKSARSKVNLLHFACGKMVDICWNDFQ